MTYSVLSCIEDNLLKAIYIEAVLCNTEIWGTLACGYPPSDWDVWA